ncbi:SDR family NAD(P)-dependent oxidoreductase [Aspergillus ibericus CBS 121593]|uniref:Gluconate 5-dehydrogenase n=1 Tax=Aspergillus ibericus CBS 121593 TaxID=1448316 RepID=A0A395H5V7_9EURO|nr:gluconate 5-dehydrogenase [Aspergillus ibericus CBS 121593]RAL03003.1 gluconate 5-dehydrogenase [Aspergillus ibericus CBS 121593]
MSSTLRLQRKLAIVTGSSSGIGRAICLRYFREGAKVVCADLSATARSQVSEEADIATHELITNEGGNGDIRPNRLQTAVDRFGRLDIMVNNAGISLEARKPAMCHLTDEDIRDTTMRVNAKSVFLGCKYATAQMLKQTPHSSGDRGWIINISSIMGSVAGPQAPAYCASKGAVSSLTKQIAVDYAPHRIHVNAICPGFTQTALLKQTTENHPFNGLGYPDDIARLAVVLASNDVNWITGILLPVDGGYTAQ